MSAPLTVEALERERQARLKEAVAGEPDYIEEEEPEDEWKDDKRQSFTRQQKAFSSIADMPTCTSYSAAEKLVLKTMKAGGKLLDLRLDLTLQRLQVVPGEVLKLGDSLRELTVVGNRICEMPAELDLCRRLRVLNLAANDLSGLPDLSRLRELAHVGLACNRVDDRSLPAVVRCLPASLASLDLGANELCSLESLLSAFEARALPGLRQLTLKSNPLGLIRLYRLRVAATSFGSALTLLDGVPPPPNAAAVLEDAMAAAAAAAAAAAPSAAPVEAEADTDAVGAEERAAAMAAQAAALAAAKAKLTAFRVTIERLGGVPPSDLPPPPPPEPPPVDPKAKKGAPPPEPEPPKLEDLECLVISLSMTGETRSTRPVPRGTESVIDFEDTAVVLELERTVALRDELLITGIPFEVLSVPPKAKPLEGEAPPATTPVLIGRLVSHWAPLAEGETKMTQVCQQIIQPPAPEGAKAKRGKKPKLPPPFTLSLTVTIELVST